MKNLIDLEKAIKNAIDSVSEVEFNFDYLESDYKEIKEKLEDISAIVEESYSPEMKLSEIKTILER